MMPQEEAPANSAAGPCLLSPESAENISERLSNLDNLYFPRAKQSSAVSPSQRKSLFLELISCDVAVFLERYGSQLKLEELEQFDVLKEDYEINWHLKRLRSLLSPTKEDLELKSVMIKNRRRAYLDKLVDEGHYFSEDAMREREPYLHHEYLGQFQDPSGRSMARPGERWFETLMRQAEEAMLVEKIRGEQQRRGVAQSDWVGNDNQSEQMVEVETESEEEESEEEEVESEKEAKENHVANGASRNEEVLSCDALCISEAQTTSTRSVEEVSLSYEEMQDRLDQFTTIMQQKFLSGEDDQHFDYTKIDEDERLDDHWIKEASYDAEEKYFDDD